MAHQGGIHEQHVHAGKQSHKNQDHRDRPKQADDRNRGQAGDQNRDEHHGGTGSFAEDRHRASEVGRKGGRA